MKNTNLKSKSIIKRLLSEPLLHFVVLGVLGNFLYQALLPKDRQGIIEIKQSTLQALQKQQEDLAGRPLTEEEKHTILENHIDEEVLLLEAEKRGFDKLDYRVRKRLLSVMRSTLSEQVPDPTRAQMEAFFRQKIDKYRTPKSISFQQVFFDFVSEKRPEDPNEILTALNGDADFQSLGDFSRLGNTSIKATRVYLVSSYGVEFADVVLNLPVDKWTGPIRSKNGTHYVKVVQQHASEEPTFEQVEDYLRQDYLMTKSLESQYDKIARMRQGYTIIVEGQE